MVTSNLPRQWRLDKEARAVRFCVKYGERKVESLIDVQYLKTKYRLAPNADYMMVEGLFPGELWRITEEVKELIASGQPEPVLLTSLTLKSARKINESRIERPKANDQSTNRPR